MGLVPWGDLVGNSSLGCSTIAEQEMDNSSTMTFPDTLASMGSSSAMMMMALSLTAGGKVDIVVYSPNDCINASLDVWHATPPSPTPPPLPMPPLLMP
jgi:hypothetical protein